MPTKTLTIPALRTWISPAETTLSSGLIGWVFLATAQRGFWTAPFNIPDDYEPSHPSSVSFVACSDFPSEVPDTFQRFQLFTGIARAGLDPIDSNFLWSWPTPNPWMTPEIAVITADSGPGYSFPPGAFDPRDTVGFWLLRNGGSPLDTSPMATRVAASVQFTYQQRCQMPCF